jgi:hypothetical protein
MAVSNDVLEERTENLRKELDDHKEQDSKKFTDIYTTITAIKVEMAKIGVKVGAAVIIATMICNAALAFWLKGGGHAPGG